jgi:hypothetical protein
MARALAYAAALPRPALSDAPRLAFVAGCALALILAGQALPF